MESASVVEIKNQSEVLESYLKLEENRIYIKCLALAMLIREQSCNEQLLDVWKVSI